MQCIGGPAARRASQVQRRSHEECIARFDCRGLIMDGTSGGRFTRIVVACDGLTNTRLDGRAVGMGLPH